MSNEQKNFFTAAESMFKSIYKKFKADGEAEITAITLSAETLERIFLKTGLDFYSDILKDIEDIYLNPVNTYSIYKKYGITT